MTLSLLLLPIFAASALDVGRLLKTLKESSTGLSHKYNQTFLNVSGLGIETLGSGSFEHFGELTHLDLSLNDIRFVDNLAFAGLKKLQFLDLSHNSGLYTISRDSLLPLGNLEEIKLDATHISTLPSNVFKHNNKLRKVSMNTPFLVCDCDMQKIVQRFDFDGEARCLYPISLRGKPVQALKNMSKVCKASIDLKIRLNKSKRERSTGGSYWNIDCSVDNVTGHVIEMKLDGRPLHNLDGHFTVSERRYHDRHHIILQVIENFVPHHPWICYAEVDGESDAKAFNIPSSCPEESIRNHSREVHFSRTPPDTVLEIRCPNSSTVLSRECSTSGEWSPVDISICPEAGNSCDNAVNSDNIDNYLRNASNCPRGSLLSKIHSLRSDKTVTSDLLTLCSLEGTEWNRAGLGTDRMGQWKCSNDVAEPSLAIKRRSPNRDRNIKYKLLRIDLTSLDYFLPNHLAAEAFGVSSSNLATITEDTIAMNFTALDRFGTPTLYRLNKDGVWRKVPQSICKIKNEFGSKIQVSCSLRLLSFSSDFSSLLAVAPSCDVEEWSLQRTIFTTKSLIALGSIVFIIAAVAPLMMWPYDRESVVIGASASVFIIAILLRTFSNLDIAIVNQLIHAGLIHHLMIHSFCIHECSSCLLLSLSFFSLFLSLSVPPITDRFSDRRIYVTPASRLLNSLSLLTGDTLVVVGPIILMTILCLAKTENRGSRVVLILSPFLWLLIILLRIRETCDSLNSIILDALILVIPTAHTVLSLRANHDSRKDRLKSYAFHHHISFIEEETSLY